MADFRNPHSKTQGGVSIALNGLLPVDKPQGWTSHDVVDRVRCTLQVRKAGHTGTLDPIATGVLVLCLGQSTRLSSFLTDQDKRYRARIRLGISTDTLDAAGAVIARSDQVPADQGVVFQVVRRFVGEIEQIPPMFSARIVAGKRLYQLARAGQEVAREARRVRIYGIDIERFVPPLLDLTVSCSKGCYIRALADDIGRKLGCGGHLVALRRTAVGKIGLDHCIPLEDLQVLCAEGRIEEHLIDPNRALGHMPGLHLTSDQIRRFVHGTPVAGIREVEIQSSDLVRALDPKGSLLGIGRWTADGAVLKPVRVFQRLKRQPAA